MDVRKIRLTKFMVHDDRTFEFPAAGVVLVTGPNGSGKSSIIEAIATCLWGKTLRGTLPWRDEEGQVSIVTDVVEALRTRKGRKTKLAFSLPDGELYEKFDTMTKAQESLDPIVGAFNVWQRTQVFSSQDVAHFTLATDGERKRLLESILGLERFDEALGFCRNDLRTADKEFATQQRALAVIKERRFHVEEAVLTAKENLAEAADAIDTAKLETKIERLREAGTKCADEIRISSGHFAETERVGDEADAQASVYERAFKKLGAECPTCLRPVTSRDHAKVREKVKELRTSADASRVAVEDKLASMRENLDELRDELDTTRGRREELAKALAVAKAKSANRASAERGLGKAEVALTKAEEELSAVDTAVSTLELESKELEACERVLGLKGVRAHVLGHALSGIEAVANGWLARIAGSGLQLSLKPYAEKKTGGVRDSISLEVAGAGGGYGYQGASGGERRRIDVALLLALAEIASAAHGRQRGTLFFDEVFDSLDGAGVTAVVEALDELAGARAVVVISHNEELADRLSGAQRIML